MQIWLISDTHHGHENMYRFLRDDGITRVRHQFTDAAEGDAFMVDAWNTVVKPEDHVWHLGDVGMSRQSLEIVRRLNGKKRLIIGNHDRENMEAYRNVGFQKIVGARQFEGLLLTHYPVHPISISHKVDANVHGHIHYHPSPPGKYINVSVEQEHMRYTPIALEVVQKMARRLKDEANSMGA
ncbi:MAG: metallophosphoesterase [Nanoarchaeota archaeon]